MEIYKVGGCVRDKLLGIKSSDNDFVVVGSNIDEMLSLGFKPVGKDFPVFLHPKTNEEYALARSEKKVSVGYRGFVFNTAPNTSLIDDLARRDITINSIAEDKDGRLIDPFGGQNDLKLGIIRHISDAFVEDPLRVLRVARFSAKLNFTVTNETKELMKKIVNSGALKSLSLERIWREINKAMLTKHSEKFFIILQECNALEEVLPEVIPLIKDTNSFNLFTTMCEKIEALAYPIHKRLALLYYFVSKYFTSDEITAFIDKSGMNKQSKKLSLILVKHYNSIKMLHKINYDRLYTVLANLDPLRREERFHDFICLIYCIANSQHDIKTLGNLEILKKIVSNYQNIDYNAILQSHPKSFVNTIREVKLNIIKDMLSSNLQG